MQIHASSVNDRKSSASQKVSTEALISLLNDDHAREISTTIVDEPKTAHEIVSECESSRTTVYRRLGRLEDAGLIKTALRYDADGHHRTTYQLRYDSLSLRLDTGGLNCVIESTDS